MYTPFGVIIIKIGHAYPFSTARTNAVQAFPLGKVAVVFALAKAADG